MYCYRIIVSEGIRLALWTEVIKQTQPLEYQTHRGGLSSLSGRAFLFVVNGCGGVCNIKILVQLSPEVAAWITDVVVPAECKYVIAHALFLYP